MRDEDEDYDRCPACGEVIPPEYQDAHEAGADRRRIDCPAQDLAAVRRRAEGYRGHPLRGSW